MGLAFVLLICLLLIIAFLSVIFDNYGECQNTPVSPLVTVDMIEQWRYEFEKESPII